MNSKNTHNATRPPLAKDLKSEDFKEYYFLKEELKEFCRKEGLKISGSKNQLEERIIYYLDTGKSLENTQPFKNKNRNPDNNSTKMLRDILPDAINHLKWICSMTN